MAHDVFISYATEDKRTADAVCAALEAHGIRCWIAPRDVLPGRNYAEEIVKAIRQSRAMVLVLTAHSNHSAAVAREVERAADSEIYILTFRTELVAPSPRLEFFISATHWLDALEPPLEAYLKRLVQTVELLLSSAEDRPIVRVRPKPREERGIGRKEIDEERRGQNVIARLLDEMLRRAAQLLGAMLRTLARSGRVAVRVLASTVGLPWTGLRAWSAALRGGRIRARKIPVQRAAGGFLRIHPIIRYVVGGGAVLAVGLACYGIYQAATGGGSIPSTARIMGKEFDRGDGGMLRPTFEVGPATRAKSVVRMPFRVRYEGEAPGCSGHWQSDNATHQEAVDRGELGIHLEGLSGEVSQLVYATGVGAADAVLKCDTWYEGAWIFAPAGDYGTALVRYPSFQPVQVALPDESSSASAMPTYVVREEDTLASIAEYFTVSTPDILAANPGLTTDSVTEGRSLKIPVSQEQAVSKELSYAALELEEADIGARAVEVSFIALGLDPNNGEAYFAMGIGLYNLGKPVESVDPLKKAVELRPQVAIYHTWLAAALLATGDTAGARLEAEEALRLQPDEPIALGVLDSLESAPPPSATRQPAAMPTPGLTETPPPQIETPTPTFGPVPAAYAGLGLDGEAAGGGVVVQEVYAGGPAENAGLKAGDVITAVDGQSVSNAEAVADAIVKKRPGDEITLSVRRDGQEEDIVVTLGERIGG